MRLMLPIVFFSALMLAGCQTGGDGTGAVPASAVPPSMVATATAANGGPMDVADLVNAPAGTGRSQMLARGYRIGMEQGQTIFWWNPKTTICATTVTAKGRYQTIGTAEARYCGQNSS
jgi:hypothetical protein